MDQLPAVRHGLHQVFRVLQIELEVDVGAVLGQAVSFHDMLLSTRRHADLVGRAVILEIRRVDSYGWPFTPQSTKIVRRG